MKTGWGIPCLVSWTLVVCSPLFAQFAEVPLAVQALVQRADPNATVEYCGAISNNKLNYYLFLLQRKQLAGSVLVRQQPGTAPVITDADTSLFPFRGDSRSPAETSMRDAIEILLRKRNTARTTRTSQRASSPELEISAVGGAIDHVIYPISGFRLGSNSTREILRCLRAGPTIAVNPGAAPPGSIIVSPTQFSPYGPIYLGHAGIVGPDSWIYSADARYDGALTRNFSLINWLKQFSGTNGFYAFVIHAPPDRSPQRFHSKITWLNIDRSSFPSCIIPGSYF
jgi:hypothetical protein